LASSATSAAETTGGSGSEVQLEDAVGGPAQSATQLGQESSSVFTEASGEVGPDQPPLEQKFATSI
jgi:hypothetical protein